MADDVIVYKPKKSISEADLTLEFEATKKRGLDAVIIGVRFLDSITNESSDLTQTFLRKHLRYRDIITARFGESYEIGFPILSAMRFAFHTPELKNAFSSEQINQAIEDAVVALSQLNSQAKTQK